MADSMFPDVPVDPVAKRKVRRRKQAEIPCCPEVGRLAITPNVPAGVDWVHAMAHGAGSITVSDLVTKGRFTEQEARAALRWATDHFHVLAVGDPPTHWEPNCDTKGAGKVNRRQKEAKDKAEREAREGAA